MIDQKQISPDISLISPKQFYDRVNKILDTPIGIHAVYALMKKRNFPSVKIGGRYYVIESRVGDWLAAQSKSNA